MSTTSDPANPHFTVSPERPAYDAELHIRLNGLLPGSEVTLLASLRDPRDGEWRSSAAFTADLDGTVDLHRDAPVRGSYRTVDPMGLIWSMEPVDAPSPGRPADFLAPTPLTLVAETAGKEIARIRVERLRVPDGLQRTDVRERGLVGTMYCPQRDSSSGRGGDALPGVLQLGGSEGGMHEEEAALLAAHGYVVLALAYYGMPGLPATLQNIPLEYFGEALEYLGRQPRVRADRISVIGASKGGEAALHIGATYPQVRAVVSVVGSGLSTQGISQSITTGTFLEIVGTPVANWIYQGRELPYVPNVVTPELEALVAAGEPVSLRMVFEPGLLLTDLVQAATIPVERIQGAVLMITGGDDQFSAPGLHEVAAQRLADRKHPHTWRHTVYEGAGHFICMPPYGPTTRSLTPGPGVTFRAGGSSAVDAKARVDARQEILRFLAEEIGLDK